MRTKVPLFLSALTIALAGCSNQPAPTPEPTKTAPAAPQAPITERVSSADKAAIDELGTDVEKLLAEYNRATGIRQEYALFRLGEVLTGNTESIEYIEKHTRPWSDPWRVAKNARTGP
ncbi:MAG: hypothetical protein RL538_610 [Candidatus Parcubacteria bacterium]|jgi:hypothetical protein